LSIDRRSARRGALALAAIRTTLGAAIVVAPQSVTERWLGADNARHPTVAALSRMLGARDLTLGLAMIATLEEPRLAPRVQLLCALADAGDAVATVVARDAVPAAGFVAAMLASVGACAAGVGVARGLQR
jgi:hypothetical protein